MVIVVVRVTVGKNFQEPVVQRLNRPWLLLDPSA